VDWTLLIDGQADARHHDVEHAFAAKLKGAGYPPPGPAVFGQLTFSHELIHRIGGDNDTNANLTRRILLLLESISRSKVDAHQRVVRLILDRYLDAERSFRAHLPDLACLYEGLRRSAVA
jgi:hypothetical protein